ncbi:restriction endonuclease [Streptomyces sp. NPDC058284]|uniref:restriction endonuclease n=1 Tax=unclassified Streptomyces TaxID=2593676 RepID=UPI0036610BD4
MLIRDSKGGSGRAGVTGALSGPVVILALIGAVLCAAILLFVRFAHWAGAHPLAAALLGLLAVPVLYVLLRAMPRARELRRAAREGMAQADRELAEAARAEGSPAPLTPAGTEASALLDPTVPAAAVEAQDGRTAVLPPPVPDFTALDPDGFEAAVAALCERDGCREIEVVGGAGDLGADVLAIAPDGRRVVVQCKQYGPTNKVGSQDLQRFGGTCWTVHGAQLAAVVTTSQFTEPAREYADSCGIRCVDGESLTAWAEGSGPAPWGPAMVDGV